MIAESVADGIRKEQIKSILILRPDNLGDVILFSGALEHIRNAFPNANISLCAKRYALSYLALCPHIDRLLEWERVPLRRILGRLPRTSGYLANGLSQRLYDGLLKSYRSDLLLLPLRSPNLRVDRIAMRLPARYRAVVTGDRENRTEVQDRIFDHPSTIKLELSPAMYRQHEIRTTGAFLNRIGISVRESELSPQVWTAKTDEEWATCAIPRDLNGITVGLAPGVTSMRSKFYPGRHYAELFNSLKPRSFRIIMLGSAVDIPMCREVQDQVSRCDNITGVINLAGRTNVRQMIEVLKRCEVVISQETATLHLATALHVPAVGIVGGGHYGRFYPWGNSDLSRPVTKHLDCFHCNWQCRFPIMRCIQEISPVEIAAATTFLLQMKAAHA